MTCCLVGHNWHFRGTHFYPFLWNMVSTYKTPPCPQKATVSIFTTIRTSKNCGCISYVFIIYSYYHTKENKIVRFMYFPSEAAFRNFWIFKKLCTIMHHLAQAGSCYKLNFYHVYHFQFRDFTIHIFYWTERKWSQSKKVMCFHIISSLNN